MSGIFEMFTDVDGRYRFRLRDSRGEVIANSDAYSSRTEAEAAITAVRATAATAVVDDQT